MRFACGRRVRASEIDRTLLGGEWVALGIGRCMRCRDERRLYTSCRMLVPHAIYHLMCFLLRARHAAKDLDLPVVALCADCSQSGRWAALRTAGDDANDDADEAEADFAFEQDLTLEAA